MAECGIYGDDWWYSWKNKYATASILRNKDEAMESDADVMSKPGIDIFDDDIQGTNPKSIERPTSKKWSHLNVWDCNGTLICFLIL